MNIAVHNFDRVAYIDRLKEAGIDDKHARAHAEALDAAFRETVATKADVEAVRVDLQAVRTELKAEIATTAANLKVDILRWLVVTQVAMTGILLAAMKFVK